MGEKGDSEENGIGVGSEATLRPLVNETKKRGDRTKDAKESVRVHYQRSLLGPHNLKEGTSTINVTADASNSRR